MDFRPDRYQEVVRRAELFSYISELVRAQEGPEDAVTSERPPSAEGLTLLPTIQVFGQSVVCNGARLDLARRPLSLKLFQLFCAKDDLRLTRAELIEGIYDLKNKPLISGRHMDALVTNVVKLVSRTRILATAYLGRGSGRGIEWFGYDPEGKIWTLYRLRRDYLAIMR